MTARPKKSSAISSGALLLVVVGVLLLLGNLNILFPRNLFHMLSTYWPGLLIALGIARLFFTPDAQRGQGVVVLSLGIFLQLSMLDLWPGGVGAAMSVASILFGLWLLIAPAVAEKVATAALTDDRIEIDMMAVQKVFRCASRQLESCSISATFSQVAVHFDEATPSSAVLTIHVDVLLASVTLFIPREWEVSLHTTSRVGRMTDKRKSVVGASAAAHCEIHGSITIGELEIREPKALADHRAK